MNHTSTLKLNTAAALVGALLLSLNVAKAQTLLHNYDFSTGNGNDTVGDANGVVTGSAGIYGGSLNTYANQDNSGLELNGPDVTNSAVAGIDGSFTLEDFVTISGNSANERNWQTLFSFGSSTDSSTFLVAHNKTSYGLSPWISLGSASSGGATIDLPSDSESLAGGSYMVALTYDASTDVVRAYLNGSIAGAVQLSGNFDLAAVAGNSLGGIGSYDYYGDPSADAGVQDFAIYSGSLTGDQIAADYDAGAPVSGVATPEPGTWAMLLAGLGSLVALQKRRRMAQF